jgi:hypothetical protein
MVDEPESKGDNDLYPNQALYYFLIQLYNLLKPLKCILSKRGEYWQKLFVKSKFENRNLSF